LPRRANRPPRNDDLLFVFSRLHISVIRSPRSGRGNLKPMHLVWPLRGQKINGTRLLRRDCVTPRNDELLFIFNAQFLKLTPMRFAIDTIIPRLLRFARNDEFWGYGHTSWGATAQHPQPFFASFSISMIESLIFPFFCPSNAFKTVMAELACFVKSGSFSLNIGKMNFMKGASP
jgi:hypothetical protein